MKARNSLGPTDGLQHHLSQSSVYVLSTLEACGLHYGYIVPTKIIHHGDPTLLICRFVPLHVPTVHRFHGFEGRPTHSSVSWPGWLLV